ncbi:MAG: prolipoprotein diacylglyceryl transferase, partial [Bdellovibrionaceae bacterium]|nr:prolipoprotein diacylglyceryl transferase [Pseudobdellovibrionaceae bacterium]
ISLVLSISLFWISARAKVYELPQKQILDLSMLLMAASLIGARLFHVFYENPEYYRESPEKIVYLWDGGFVFYGGALLAFFFGAVYLYLFKVDERGKYFDAFAPVLAFTYGAGRIGCFLAGCCYGKSCDLPWSVDGRHPTQLYATFWEFGVLLLLLGLEKRGQLKKTGNLFLLWVVLHTIGRLGMESFREDFRGERVFGLSISTVISLALLIISSALLLVRRPRAE